MLRDTSHGADHSFQIQLLLDQKSSEWAKDHWQYVWPVRSAYFSQLTRGTIFRFRVNIGRLDRFDGDGAIEATFRQTWQQVGFWSFTTHKSGADDFWKKRKNITEAQMRDDAHGHVFLRRYSWKGRESYTFTSILWTFAYLSRLSSGSLRLESEDRSKKRNVTADNLHEMVQQAKGLDKGKDLWFVAEGTVKQRSLFGSAEDGGEGGENE